MNLPDLDKVIHERARLRILACLTSQPRHICSFTQLKETLDMTAGNLSSQLSVLERSEYIVIEKKFRGKKPLTEVVLTEKGSEAFGNYIDTLDQMIAALKSGK
ncbi:MAG: transcriptional regulator [Rectinema sp.]|jgi:DNA-binding MarR family transcriptional regulator|uniref:Transcriptional regulator, ArsR family n=1 Tax=uncultured spirochete TaxID=156406 RepID=A0A3P3XMS6_9SPIR|nr:Transcriptional regulator, ArsR family [uncultured spirochete]